MEVSNSRAHNLKCEHCNYQVCKCRPTKIEMGPVCHHCGSKITNLQDFFLRMGGMQKKFLCINCSDKIENNSFPDSNPETQSHLLSTTQNCDSDRDDTSSNSSADTIYDCHLCDDYFSSIHRLDSHIGEKHSEMPSVKCRICDEVFRTSEIRNFHEIQQHRNPKTNSYKCTICTTESRSLVRLEEHMNKHTGNVSMTCEVCGKGFASKRYLQNHMEMHKESLDHKCNVCSKAFKRMGSLQRHMFWHSDERPFVCNQCPKSYRDFTDLKRHKYTHGGYEKRFKCLICEKSFYENKTLRHHMKAHESKREVVTVTNDK